MKKRLTYPCPDANVERWMNQIRMDSHVAIKNGVKMGVIRKSIRTLKDYLNDMEIVNHVPKHKNITAIRD